jgi:hypothetical protein
MRSGGRASEKHYSVEGGTENFPALNVPKQCTLVFVEIRLGQGKALGSGLCYEEIK